MSETYILNIKELVGIQPEGKLVLRGSELGHVQSLKNAWLHIKEGKIAAFGEMNKLPEKNLERFIIIDATDRLVLPAFVDSHTHLVYAGTREDEFIMRLHGASYEQIADAGGGILNSANKLAAASEELLYKQAKNRLDELIAMGTGSIEIKSGYGLTVAAELKMLRVIQRLKANTNATIKATFLAAHALPLAYKNDADGFINLMIEEALPIVATEKLAEYIDVFCEQGYFDTAQTLKIITAAAKFGLKPKIHVNQFYAFGAIPELVKHGAISVDHLEVMAEADLASLANSTTMATLLPACSLFINIPYAPARTLLNLNAAVALASDFNPGSSPTGNMQLVQSLACINMRLTPEEAFNASTLNGAAAIELSHKLGSITVGKIANLLITKPIPNLGFIAYNFGHNHIEQVLLNGLKETSNNIDGAQQRTESAG